MKDIRSGRYQYDQKDRDQFKYTDQGKCIHRGESFRSSLYSEHEEDQKDKDRVSFSDYGDTDRIKYRDQAKYDDRCRVGYMYKNGEQGDQNREYSDFQECSSQGKYNRNKDISRGLEPEGERPPGMTC